MARIATALVVLVAVATPAFATVSVIGTGFARSCFEAAETRRPLRDALRLCDSALQDEALSTNDRTATLVNRGIIYMQAQKFDAAIADYDAAIKASPGTAEAYVNKGIAFLRMGDRDADAVAQLSQGLARNPLRPAIAHYSRAVAYEGLGRVREAYEDYSRAAQLAPQWSEPAEQLQRFQTIKRKTGAA